MAVYYKFKSAKDYDSVAVDGHFISVGHLKEKIFELKHLGRGTDFDLVVTNAQTNEDFSEEGELIPKNTSVLIRRVPGRSRRPMAATVPIAQPQEPKVEKPSDFVQTVNGSSTGAYPSLVKLGDADDLELDIFGSDLYAIPETAPPTLSIPAPDVPLVSKEDEESKIKALIETPALDWQQNFGRGIDGRMMGGRGFGRGGFEKKTPPQGYVCHRCKVPGHFIQHCPTNGDPNFDIKRVKAPTGIPKSMLVPTPDGSYALPSGAVAVLKPNEAAFEKEIEGMPSTRVIGDLPPELYCPLCKEVMKDAVLTSKCCFTSFCDKCIRDHIISKSACVCGVANVLADDLLPNRTLRDTITRILESNNNSGENAGSAFHIQDMESRNPQAKIPSPMQSAASKVLESLEPPQKEEEALTAVENESANEPLRQEKFPASGVPDVLEATQDSKNFREASQGSAPLADEEVQQKPISGDIVKKKKKKKVKIPPSAAELQWRGPTPQDHMAENYMMSMGPAPFNPYWNGVQPGLDGFMAPYGGLPMPYMGYGVSPMDVGFGGVIPHDPFTGPSYMPPPYGHPPRDHGEMAMGFNGAPTVMRREEFDARKTDLKRKHEAVEKRVEKEPPKDREHISSSRKDGGSSTFDGSSRSKSKSSLHQERGSSPRRTMRDHHGSSRDRDGGAEPDKKSSHHRHHHRSSSSSKRRSESPSEKHKGSVFSRISFPEGELEKKKKRSRDRDSGGEQEDEKQSKHRAARDRERDRDGDRERRRDRDGGAYYGSHKHR